MMNILIYLDTFDGVLPEPELKEPYKLWSGRQLVSFAFPRGLNLSIKNNSYDDDSQSDILNHVIIRDGVLVQGRIDSKVMNSGSKGLIHIVYNDFGIKAGQRLLDDLQNIVTRYLVITGFSVGIGDLVADSKTNEKIKNTIIKTKKQVSK